MRFLIIFLFVLFGSFRAYSSTASFSSTGLCSASAPSLFAYLTTKRFSDFLDKSTEKFLAHLTEKQKEQLGQAKQAVWMIGDHIPLGTVFFVSPNHVVTNWHVIVNQAVPSLSLCREGSERRLSVQRLVSVSAIHDLALLEIEGDSVSHLEVRKDLVSNEEELVLLGYPDGIFKYTLKTSPLKTFKGDDIWTYFSVNRVYLFGNSGGPFLDTNNKVVGVISGSIDNYINMIKGSVLKNFIAGDIGLSCGGRDSEACIKKATSHLQKKAKRGSQTAQYQLAVMYYGGLGVPRDFSLAFHWYRLSAEQGHKFAQHQLGIMYYKGEGVPQDFSSALNWLRLSAERGYAPSQHALGKMYGMGDGVPKDLSLALEWFRLSAGQGYVPAQYMLHEIFKRELGQ